MNTEINPRFYKRRFKEFNDQVSGFQLIKKDSDPLSYHVGINIINDIYIYTFVIQKCLCKS